MGSFEEKLAGEIQLSFMCFCKYVNQRKKNKNRSIKWRKKKEAKHEEIEFHNYLIQEFLLPFTDCIKMEKFLIM